MEKLLDQRETAEILGLSPRSLEAWRVQGAKIPFLRVGGRIRYRESDIQAFLDANTATSTSDPGPGGAER